MSPSRRSHQTCPYCHMPVAIEQFEFASDRIHAYRVCPECGHPLLLSEPSTASAAARSTAEPTAPADAAQALPPCLPDLVERHSGHADGMR
ncbi:hypothetical protein [Thauera aromatica]|uniref:Uncharacterized protein n=1 Tax=Thauera aromatica K172 TaxID=44139 RepID=A0A2R4BMM4_THAAR|nr:hypothetical protein [Thauera aromatica]AVR88587.1 hypothetical protein Tharo_1677 [Thauera aromatica K172]MCK2097494.1 hypothetical protein [Thauera aromatica]